MNVLHIFMKQLVSLWLHTSHFWQIYWQLHHAFEAIIDLDPVISAVPDTVNCIDNKKISLIPEMQELCGGDSVIGNSGKNDGHMYADFMDSD